MKSALFLILTFVLSLSAYAQEDEVFPPKPYPPDRYEAMKNRSPFVLPSVTEVVMAPATPGWTSDFSIVSVTKIGEETIVLARQISTDQRVAIRARANAQGIRLVDLRMSPDPRDVSATVEKDGLEGTITYDGSFLSKLPRSLVPGNPGLKSE